MPLKVGAQLPGLPWHSSSRRTTLPLKSTLQRRLSWGQTVSQHLLGSLCSPVPSACSLGTSWYWHKSAHIAQLVSDTSSLSQSVSDFFKWPWPFSHPTGATLANTPKFGSGFHLVFPIVYGFPAKFSSPVNLFSSKSIKCNSAGNTSWRGDLQICIALCQGWANSFESRPLSDCYCYLSTK